MPALTRSASDETRRPRLSLKTWQGRDCSTGGERTTITSPDESKQLFEALIRAAVNRWDVDRRMGRGGLFASNRKWDRKDAERAWTSFFSNTREKV
jgi:hypothetical protein